MLPVASQPWLAELLRASPQGIALFGPSGRVVRTNERLARLLERTAESLDGADLARLLDDPAFPTVLAAARSRGWWHGRARHGERDLELRLDVSPDGYGVLVCDDAGERNELSRRAASLAAMVEEHASHAATARELAFEQSERLTTLYQISVDALESATVPDTARRIGTSLVDDLGATNVAIWLLDADQRQLRRIAALGGRAEALPVSVAVATAPNAAEALATGRAVEPRGGGALAGYAVFPLPGREQPLGVLTVDQAPDLDRVQVYGPHLATAINNAIMADELARANAQLRAIDQQKSEFLNVVAHDLRTPLTCIRTYTDLIGMYVDEPPETYAEFLAVISEETERMGELLDNFLDLARIENATLRYELEPVRLDAIAQHFLTIYRAKAEAEGIGLSLELESAVPLITADPRRLEQALSNLLSNAVKFTPAGGRVTLVVGHDEGGVRLAVSDTGPGVPEADRQRIFERFRQADNGDRSKGGAGLGLAIAQALVTDHGGRIWVEEAPGGGSRFVVWLPWEPPPDTAAGRCR